MVVGKKATYSGHVQGVGFRYTTQRLATGLSVAGYVKNLPDGRVELVVEGEADQVETLLQRVAARMEGYIVNAEIIEQQPQGFRNFGVRH